MDEQQINVEGRATVRDGVPVQIDLSRVQPPDPGPLPDPPALPGPNYERLAIWPGYILAKIATEYSRDAYMSVLQRTAAFELQGRTGIKGIDAINSLRTQRNLAADFPPVTWRMFSGADVFRDPTMGGKFARPVGLWAADFAAFTDGLSSEQSGGRYHVRYWSSSRARGLFLTGLNLVLNETPEPALCLDNIRHNDHWDATLDLLREVYAHAQRLRKLLLINLNCKFWEFTARQLRTLADVCDGVRLEQFVLLVNPHRAWGNYRFFSADLRRVLTFQPACSQYTISRGVSVEYAAALARTVSPWCFVEVQKDYPCLHWDTGKPVGGPTGPGVGDLIVQRYEKGTIKADCKTWLGSFEPNEEGDDTSDS